MTGGSFALGSWCVRRVGYGAMQLTGDGVFGPPRDRDEALRVLRAAVDSGVNHIDTAQYYGASVVNELIREALFPYPSELAIVSKVAARGDPDGAVLRQGIEDNLTTLGISRLAVVNLRMMDPSASPDQRFDAQLAVLIKAREEGLIDGIGLSNVSRRHLLSAADQAEIRGPGRRPGHRGELLPGPSPDDRPGRNRAGVVPVALEQSSDPLRLRNSPRGWEVQM